MIGRHSRYYYYRLIQMGNAATTVRSCIHYLLGPLRIIPH